MCNLITNCFGHRSRLVECRRVGGGVAEIAVGSINCFSDRSVNFVVLGNRVFNRNLFTAGVAGDEFGVYAFIA